jgi:pimeloyl-ACP methyl ester carboxylesterase
MPVTPLVLVHGGASAATIWDLVVPGIDGPVLAVDLPGRGIHPAPLESVTLHSAARSVVADIDAAGFDEVVLAGHSLAGCSMPTAIALLGPRVRHAVFIACTVPEDGTSAFDTLEPEVKDRATRVGPGGGAATATSDFTRQMFGNDLDEDQLEWMRRRLVPEGYGLTSEAVDLSPLKAPFPRTWVRPLHDRIIVPEKQRRFARNVGNCRMIDIDAAHMCMISQPDELARILSVIATEPDAPAGYELGEG